jgi:hypothetical protein
MLIVNAVSVAQLIIVIVKGYLLCGLAFAIPFIIFGIHRVDPSAKNGTMAFRLMVLPGITLFWPLLLTRLLRGQEKPTECNAHRMCELAQIRKAPSREAKP